MDIRYKRQFCIGEHVAELTLLGCKYNFVTVFVCVSNDTDEWNGSNSSPYGNGSVFEVGYTHLLCIGRTYRNASCIGRNNLDIFGGNELIVCHSKRSCILRRLLYVI